MSLMTTAEILDDLAKRVCALEAKLANAQGEALARVEERVRLQVIDRQELQARINDRDETIAALRADADTWSKRAHDMAAERNALRADAERWQPIETAPKGKIVLVYYKNQLGNGRTMRACYYNPDTLESETSDSGFSDEGWYEESEAYEYLMPLDHEPSHWQPLPTPPIDAAMKGAK